MLVSVKVHFWVEFSSTRNAYRFQANRLLPITKKGKAKPYKKLKFLHFEMMKIQKFNGFFKQSQQMELVYSADKVYRKPTRFSTFHY